MSERRQVSLDTIVIAVLFTNTIDDNDKAFLQERRPHRVFVVNTADAAEWEIIEESTFYRLESLDASTFTGSTLEDQIVVTILGMTTRGRPQRLIYIKGDGKVIQERKIALKRIVELLEKAKAEVHVE